MVQTGSVITECRGYASMGLSSTSGLRSEAFQRMGNAVYDDEGRR